MKSIVLTSLALALLLASQAVARGERALGHHGGGHRSASTDPGMLGAAGGTGMTGATGKAGMSGGVGMTASTGMTGMAGGRRGGGASGRTGGGVGAFRSPQATDYSMSAGPSGTERRVVRRRTPRH